MEWYWTTLIVIGYIIMMVLTAALLNKYAKRMDKDECILAGLLWPFALSFLIIGLPISGFAWLISTIADLWEKWEMRSK